MQGKRGKERLLNHSQMDMLWRNIDKHKGKNSHWIANPDRAFDEICAEWKAAEHWNEDKPISQKQLEQLINDTGRRSCCEKRSKYDLYEYGSALLRPRSHRFTDQEVAASGQVTNTNEGRDVAQFTLLPSKR